MADLMGMVAEHSRDAAVDPCSRWACIRDRMERRRHGVFSTACGLWDALADWGGDGVPVLQHGEYQPQRRFRDTRWETVATGADVVGYLRGHHSGSGRDMYRLAAA